MAKIAIKSEKITPFGGIFHVMDQFSSVCSFLILVDHFRCLNPSKC